MSLCPTSACCTPGGIRRPHLLTFDTAFYCCCFLCKRVVHLVWSQNSPFWHFIPHCTVVVSYVSVLYTRGDPKMPLTDVWYRIVLSLCPTSACYTPGGIRRFPLLTFMSIPRLFKYHLTHNTKKSININSFKRDRNAMSTVTIWAAV